ncbi:MAG: ATP-binding protein [Bdellovibrionota bacterium]
MLKDPPVKSRTEFIQDRNPEHFVQAVLNILEDFSAEKNLLGDSQKAVVNILEDFTDEKERLESTQKAVLNILDDFVAEKQQLESTQKAILNILDDFESEKNKVEEVNHALRVQVLERTAAEQASFEKGIALSRSNSELEQFAYVASHDLQEPLRMVSSYVQLLAEKYQGKLEPEAEKYIQYAVEGATRMHSLIGGLLEYSRIGRDESPGHIDTNLSLQQAMANLYTSIKESGAEVTHDTLPSAVIDQTQLAQVFQNLIGNAIKFTRKDVNPKVHISVTLRDRDRDRDREWLFSVTDNGIGLEARHAERIFMIFQRLHGRTTYPGTGIGLAICKKVVERFGGNIWAESTPGLGSTFFFTLPQV